jgi:hypothetical protein
MNMFLDPKNLLLIIVLTALWTIPWKGVALWKAVKNGNKVWFVVLLLLNTLAILEILYIFVFSKMSQKNQNKLS